MTPISIAPFSTFEEMVFWIARRFLFVREVGGANKGLWVQLFQQYTGTHPGDSWCASYVSYVLGVASGGASNVMLPKTASCDVMLEVARANGWLTEAPQVGDVFLLLNSPADAHHTGFVTAIKGPMLITGIAGNTSADGRSSNGDRVAEHDLSVTKGKITFVHYPRPPMLGASPSTLLEEISQ